MQPLAVITDTAIDLAVLRAHVTSDDHGAIAEFTGVVRNHDNGKPVAELEYQIHPDALPALTEILHRHSLLHPEARIAAAHRHGLLHIGDVAFAAVVSSAHRDLAFTLLRDVVESVKAELPIWKRQQFADGSHEWVNFA